MKRAVLAVLVAALTTAACVSDDRAETVASAEGEDRESVTTTTVDSPPSTSAPAPAAVPTTNRPAPRPGVPVTNPAPAYRPTPPVTTARVVLPDDSFEVRFEGRNYLCQPPWLGGYSHFDCERYSGGQAPSRRNSDDLYCSGSKSFPECSELWYPDELDDYDLITMSSQLHLCKDAFLAGSSFGDMDCAPYEGGEPRQVSFFSALKCSPSGVSLQCEDDYYPSEMKGLRLARIDFTDYVCRDSYNGDECYRWSGSGSPKSAAMGMPDLYCNNSGTCAQDGYPSGY